MPEPLVRLLEDHLRQARRLEAVGSLWRAGAHDFNNFLSIVIGYSELLALRFDKGDPMHGELEEITVAGTRAVELNRQLMAFSHHQVMPSTLVDVNDVVTGVEKLVRRIMGEPIDVISRLAPSLDGVMADPSELERIILHLAVNAREAMPNGGRLILTSSNVELTAEQAYQHGKLHGGRYVMLAIADTGSRVDGPPLDMSSIEATLESPVANRSGLASAHHIVRRWGGSIEVASNAADGTELRVFLPSVGAPPFAGTGSSDSTESEPVRGHTILIVEDDDSMRAMLGRILRGLGYHTVEAHGAGDALVACDQHQGPIDLMLSEMFMPRMSGPELASRLSSAHPNLKLLFMADDLGGGTTSPSISSATRHVLKKPITVRSLSARVNEALIL